MAIAPPPASDQMTLVRLYATLFMVFALCDLGAEAWITSSPFHLPPRKGTPSSRPMVESISLEALDADHTKVGAELAGSVQRWLDYEWMPQAIHMRIGESCRRTYVQCRQSGQNDLMAVMVQTADDLSLNWEEYDEDAFVNAWDVSNYVSDFLTVKSGIEGCECTARIH